MIPMLPAFRELVLARIAKGQQVYGGASFRRSTDDLLAELRDELADVIGWCYVLQVRLGAACSPEEFLDGPSDHALHDLARAAAEVDTLEWRELARVVDSLPPIPDPIPDPNRKETP